MIEAEPEANVDNVLTAVMVTGLTVGIAAGGVYTPDPVIVPTLLFPPATAFTCHVTSVSATLATVAVKVTVLPKRTWLAPLTVTATVGKMEHPLARMTKAGSDTMATRKREN